MKSDLRNVKSDLRIVKSDLLSVKSDFLSVKSDLGTSHFTSPTSQMRPSASQVRCHFKRSSNIALNREKGGCRCGINQKPDAKSKRKYDSRGRCSCNGTCAKMCKCHGLCGGKECGGNIDQTTINTPKRRRKRFKHDLQKTPTKNSLSFMQDRGENLHVGDPNLLEYYACYLFSCAYV